MKRKLFRIPWLILVCALVWMLAGCYAQVPTQTDGPSDAATDSFEAVWSEEQPTDSAETMTPNYTCRKDNLYGASRNLREVYPSADGDGFYIPSGGIQYYDVAQKTAFRACPLAGCQHTDETCPTVIPGLVFFFVSENCWYAVCRTEEGVCLKEIQPQTGRNSVLYTWSNTEEETYHLNSSFYAGGRIYVTLQVLGDENADTEGRDMLASCVELASGKMTALGQIDSNGSVSVIGASEHYALLSCIIYSEPMLSMEEYLEQHPGSAQDEYFAYLDMFSEEHTSSEYRRYDLENMTYTVVEGMEKAQLFSDPNSCFDNWFVYKLGDTVGLLDMETGVQRTLVTGDPYIINGWLMDGRLFYLHQDWEHDGSLQEYVVDLTTGEAALLYDYGESDVVAFTGTRETKRAFIGLYERESAWIAKEDYYAGRFDRSVSY